MNVNGNFGTLGIQSISNSAVLKKREKINSSLLFVCERSNWSDLATSFVRNVFSEVDVFFWNQGDIYPSLIDSWEGDYIIGFKADLIIKENILKKARKDVINFHPAPPRYRGLGGYNYAVYNEDDSFGVTCHHMVKSVDYGKIIKVLDFPILEYETASNLRVRSGAFCLILLYEIVIKYISTGNPLPISDRVWGSKLHRNSELLEWMKAIRSTNPQHKCLL